MPVFVPASLPSPDIRVIDLAALTGIAWLPSIAFYALCILVGIIAAIVLTSRRLTRRGGEPGIILDIALWAVPLGILGARIFHVLTHPNDYFYPGANLLRVLYIWEGGIAIFGALLGGAVGVAIACKFTGVRFWSVADALAPAMLLAQAFGRFGNYFNQELFGTPTTLPWGLEISPDNPAFPVGLPENTLFHPTFLYEVIWNLAGVAVILLLERHFRLRWGKAFGVYLIWYGLGRSFFESIRIDPSEIFFGVRTNIWAAWAAIVIGVVIIVVQSRRHPGLEPSVYRPGAEWTSNNAAVQSDETYSDDELSGRVDVTNVSAETAADVPVDTSIGGASPDPSRPK